jgi:Zn-dependent protease with chaperone function
MRAHRRQRRACVASDGEGDRFARPALARRATRRPLLRPFGRRPRLRHPRLQLQQPGPGNLSQREIRIIRERALQAGIGCIGAHRIDRRNVVGDASADAAATGRSKRSAMAISRTLLPDANARGGGQE